MKQEKKQFKYAVRCDFGDMLSRIVWTSIISQKLLSSSSSEFWKTVNKLRSSKSHQNTAINGVSSAADITSLWRDHFSTILNMDEVDHKYLSHQHTVVLYCQIVMERMYLFQLRM